MEGTIGEIRQFAGNFPPLAWGICDGSTISISTYTALYAIIGTQFGGDGMQTFMLPDLRGRLPIGTGQGSIGHFIEVGDVFGVETTQLTVGTMPAHAHQQMASASEPSQNTAANAVLATNGRSTEPPMPNIYAQAGSNPVPMADVTSISGSGEPISNFQPVLATNFIICMEGIFPSRN